MPPLIAVEHLSKQFRHRDTGEPVVALSDVSVEVAAGESLAVVGESGSGKSTLGRCLMRLIEPSSGRVLWQGVDLSSAKRRDLRRFRRDVQMVFQDPYDALDPRMTVRAALREPLVIHGTTGKGVDQRIEELLDLVRLDRSFLGRYPHQLSGGQQQRVGIARALANEPELLILDEPTSALDWLVRGEILELLSDLRQRLNLTFIFISHDLTAVRRVTDRTVVMYLGRIVEEAPTASTFGRSGHPYTRALLSADLPVTPGTRRTRLRLAGESPAERPAGCPLHPRCPISIAACAITEQALDDVEPGHLVACMRVTGEEPIAWPDGWDTTRPTASEASR